MTGAKQSTLDAEAVAEAVKSINAGGESLEAAAKQIAEQVAVPALSEFTKEYPALKELDVARAVDYISATITESLFEGADEDGTVVVQFDSGYLALPSGCREMLQAGIVRYLNGNAKSIAAALSGTKS